jgi:prepilin-type N-terminal cleavage/methylation domain-containing protein
VAEPRRAGFTLLEVMVAVAVLGVLTVTLVRLSAEGALLEGESRRRLEASLLADRVLLELESAWKGGAPLEAGRQEGMQEGFRVVVDVAPFEAEAFGLASLLEDAPAPQGRRDAPPLTSGPPALLVPSGRRQAPVSVVSVTVAWPQGAQEQAVTRTTFAFDRQAAAVLLEPLAEAGGAEGLGSQRGPGGEARGRDLRELQGGRPR